MLGGLSIEGEWGLKLSAHYALNFSPLPLKVPS